MEAFLRISKFLPEDFIGKLYERYLSSKVLGNVKREKMGIYYTPFYVVDYIVNNSVGDYIQDRDIDQILDVKILDPSCGSGRFLIRSFELLCESVEERLRKGMFSSKWKIFSYFNGKLDDEQRFVILSNCIYGVDLDENAVRICKFNLLSRCGSKIFENLEGIVHADAILDDIFDFSFDIVISGPPYGSYIEFKNRDLLEEQYNFGTTYSTVIFMAFAKNITKENGVNSMIIPKKIFTDDNLKVIVAYLGNGLFDVVDFGQVWEEVPLEEVVYFYKK